MNTYSRGNLEKIAYLNGNTINEIIKRRVYRDPESIWAVFRRSNYGPVMTRLAISSIEMGVTKKEVMDLMKGYESQGVSKEIQDMSDKKIKIPMLGKTESLNASVATGVILYEYVRQKLAK